MGALSDALQSLVGFVVLTAIFLVLVLLGGMKAGDLKLMAVVGTWLGWPMAVSAFLYVAIAGGVFSLVWAAAHGALGRTLVQVKNFWLALQGGINPTVVVRQSAAPPFPYGISIAVGAILAMIGPAPLALPPWHL
ncbi:MAG: prepilin peptidase, partial [Cyanobacteria bacterium REEB65]|nr:prepilin peptidase [Cyanobacteria bacterium REEB65]